MVLTPGCVTAIDTADCDTDVISLGGNAFEMDTEMKLLCTTAEAELSRYLRVEERINCLSSTKDLGDSSKRPHAFLQSTAKKKTSGQEDIKLFSHAGCHLQNLMDLDKNEKVTVHCTGNGIKQQGSPSSVMPLVPQCQDVSVLFTKKILQGGQQCDRNLLIENIEQTSTYGIINEDYSHNSASHTDESLHHLEGTMNRNKKNQKQKVLNKAEEKGKSGSCLAEEKCHMFIPCSDRKPLFSGDPPLDQETNESKPICSSSSLSNVLSKTITLTDSFISDGKHTDRISLDIKDIQHCVIPSEIEHSGKTNRTASSSKHFEIVNSPSISETAMKKRAKTPQKTLQLCTEYKPPTHRKKKNKSSTSKMDAEESATQIPTKQENLPLDCPVTYVLSVEPSKDECVEVIETIVITEKITSKGRGKKKKRRNQSMQRKAENENDNQTSSKKKPDALQLKPESPGQSKNENMSTLMSRKTSLYLDGILAQPSTNDKAATFREKLSSTDQSLSSSITEETQSAINGPVTLPGEDTVKQKHLFQEKDDEQAPEIQSQEPEPSAISERNEVVSAEFQCKKLNKDVVKQKPHTLNRVPKILQNIQVVIAPNDFKSIVLQCRFGEVFIDSSVVWTKEGSVLAEEKRSAGDEGRVSFTIAKVSSKDLGWYRCCLSNHHGDASSEFHLTSDVLNELVPSHNHKVELSKGVGEDVKCMPLLFREDFLSEQYFGEDQSASILTEEVHFGEGMHRKAFRTKLLDGLLPFFTPGHACVLKVHTAISYGTKNHEELICKNYNLAMEECHVQNTAREYIKAYTTVAKCAEAFGDVPEIIPIYLVHRPTNDIPYATLEEELVGDFVKYSVKDGKEINLMRRDSEAGQKCCAFQHWVYDKTDGNLLITDMQGVGMKLTDVGIATGKKGYKGFKGNCATSFIDQFKALHQCNKFCEILGLKSLQGSQQKPGRKTMASKSKTPAPRNNVFAAAHKSKS